MTIYSEINSFPLKFLSFFHFSLISPIFSPFSLYKDTPFPPSLAISWHFKVLSLRLLLTFTHTCCGSSLHDTKLGPLLVLSLRDSINQEKCISNQIRICDMFFKWVSNPRDSATKRKAQQKNLESHSSNEMLFSIAVTKK